MSLHIDGKDIVIIVFTIVFCTLYTKMLTLDLAFARLFKEKYGRLPTTWKDYWNA